MDDATTTQLEEIRVETAALARKLYAVAVKLETGPGPVYSRAVAATDNVRAAGRIIENILRGDGKVKDTELALWFTPKAIREHFEDDSEGEIVTALSDEELTSIGEAALFDDGIYRAFHEALVSALGEWRMREGAGG